MAEKETLADWKDRLDPLSPMTRKVRRNFLAWSLISIAMGWANLVPTKIQAFGLEADHIEPWKLLALLGAIVLFEGYSFALYGLIEVRAWVRYLDPEDRSRLAMLPTEAQKQAERESAHLPGPRLVLDFVLPLMIGLAAILSLFYRAV